METVISYCFVIFLLYFNHKQNNKSLLECLKKKFDYIGTSNKFSNICNQPQ